MSVSQVDTTFYNINEKSITMNEKNPGGEALTFQSEKIIKVGNDLRTSSASLDKKLKSIWTTRKGISLSYNQLDTILGVGKRCFSLLAQTPDNLFEDVIPPTRKGISLSYNQLDTILGVGKIRFLLAQTPNNLFEDIIPPNPINKQA